MTEISGHLKKVTFYLEDFNQRPEAPAIYFSKGRWDYVPCKYAWRNGEAYKFCKRLNGDNCEATKLPWVVRYSYYGKWSR